MDLACNPLGCCEDDIPATFDQVGLQLHWEGQDACCVRCRYVSVRIQLCKGAVCMAVGLSASEGRASVSIQPRWRGRSCAKEEERGPASGKGPIWGPSETEHGYGLWMVRRCWPSSAVRTILLLVRRYSQTVDVGRRGAPVTWILPGGGEAPCAFPEVVSARGVAVGARDFTGVAEGGGGRLWRRAFHQVPTNVHWTHQRRGLLG